MSASPNPIALTSDQQQQLAHLAEMTGKPWQVVLNDALASLENSVRAHPDDCETLYGAMTRLGLLGSVKDAPADLSTNPSHLEGFGLGGR